MSEESKIIPAEESKDSKKDENGDALSNKDTPPPPAAVGEQPTKDATDNAVVENGMEAEKPEEDDEKPDGHHDKGTGDIKMERETDNKMLKDLDDEAPKTFPQILMDILANGEESDTIAWLPHGRSFIIYKKKKFAQTVLPTYFKATKFTSFTRKLNRWGFTRVTRGPEMGSYYHKLFLRDEPNLCLRMSSHSSSKFQEQQQLMPNPMGMPFGGMPFGMMMNPMNMNPSEMNQQSQVIQAQLQQLQWQQYQLQQFQQQHQQAAAGMQGGEDGSGPPGQHPHPSHHGHGHAPQGMHSQGHPQGHSQGHSQGHPQGHPQSSHMMHGPPPHVLGPPPHGPGGMGPPPGAPMVPPGAHPHPPPMGAAPQPSHHQVPPPHGQILPQSQHHQGPPRSAPPPTQPPIHRGGPLAQQQQGGPSSAPQQGVPSMMVIHQRMERVKDGTAEV